MTSAHNGAQPRGTHAFVRSLGVPELPPFTSPFDPGYDVATVVGHLEQSAHLISRLKLSMACWLIAGEAATRAKIDAARRLGVPLVAGGGPFEIAQDRCRLEDFMALCAAVGIDRIEAGEGFTSLRWAPSEVVRMAEANGLAVQAELGGKHAGSFSDGMVGELLDQGHRWLLAGAEQIVVEGRESASGVGLFDTAGRVNWPAADAFVRAWGLEATVFETPTKASQFQFLSHFGDRVQLSNVRLEELLRVEIYRRGLHSDSYDQMLAPLAGPGTVVP
ncbi:MAG: phosphosulfolactate synthase [Chloroflexota bacterium]|jgi:phosphosulfolactate synthase|nr:phosphosulfolactate synthase [Chloroflexota bacterium]